MARTSAYLFSTRNERMKRIIQIIAVACAISMTAGCAVTSAKQPSRTAQGDDVVITATNQAGIFKFYVNGTPAMEGSILNIERPFKGKYKEHEVVAQCKHTKHFFSVENECDVFLDGKFAANLYLR